MPAVDANDTAGDGRVAARRLHGKHRTAAVGIVVACVALQLVAACGGGAGTGSDGAPMTAAGRADTPSAVASETTTIPNARRPVMDVGTVTATTGEPATAGSSRSAREQPQVEIDWAGEPPFDMRGPPGIERFEDAATLPSALAFAPARSTILDGTPVYWVDTASLPARSWLIVDYRDAVDRESGVRHPLVRIEMRSPAADGEMVVDDDCLDCSESRTVELDGATPAFAGTSRTATSVAWVTDDATAIVVQAPPGTLSLDDAIRIADDVEHERRASTRSGAAPETSTVAADAARDAPTPAQLAASDPYTFDGNPLLPSGTAYDTPEAAARAAGMEILTAGDVGASPVVYVAPAPCDSCNPQVIVRYLDSAFGDFDLRLSPGTFGDLRSLVGDGCYRCSDAELITLTGGQRAALTRQPGTVTSVTWTHDSNLGVALIGLADDLTATEARALANRLSTRRPVQPAAAP